MPVDDGRGAVAHVPVGGGRGAAPDRELLVSEHARRQRRERPVVHQHGRQIRIERVEAAPGLRHPRRAPGGPGRVRVGVQQVLVGADHARPVGGGQPLVGRAGPRREDAVVVEQEERRHDGRAARAVPDRVRVFRGEHVEGAAGLHEVSVARLTAQRNRILAARPQLVVAGHPQHPREPIAQQAQRPRHVVDALADVARDDQPVGGAPRPQPLDHGPVVRVADVQVADGPQRRQGHRETPTTP